MKRPSLRPLLLATALATSPVLAAEWVYPADRLNTSHILIDGTIQILAPGQFWRTKPPAHVAADWLSLLRRQDGYVCITTDGAKVQAIRWEPDIPIYPQ